MWKFASYLRTTRPGRCHTMTSATARLAAALTSRSIGCLVAAISALLLWRLPASAQLPADQTIALYAGQTVSSVEVAGQPGVTFQSVRNLIAVKPGQPLRQNDVESSLSALRDPGGFEGAVLDIEPAADGVRVNRSCNRRFTWPCMSFREQ